MHPYICMTYARDDRDEAERLCHTLAQYGFRYSCVQEETEMADRVEQLTAASVLIALTSPAAVRAETVASDIRSALGRGTTVLCTSLASNELDDRYCGGGAVLIPCPGGSTPDRHSVALFVHRLFVRHLSRLDGCFSAFRCVDDAYGRVVRYAVAAHKGDGDSCYALGHAYERGEGVPMLENEAAHWIARAAACGVADARIHMGELYLAGRGTESNYEQAFRLFTEAAEMGDVRGVYHRGLCYLNGQGVMKDPERAAEELDKAACAEYAPALWRMGLLYRDGIGTVADPRRAVVYLYKACRGTSAWNSTEDAPHATAEAADLPNEAVPSAGMAGGGARSPRLFRRREERLVGVSMRQLRRSRLSALLEARSVKTGHGDGGRAGVATRLTCFTRSHVTTSQLPEDGWSEAAWPPVGFSSVVAGDSRGTEHSVVGRRASARTARDLDVGEIATALGCLLEQGASSGGLCPHPTRALVWYRYAIRMGSTEALGRLGDAYRRGLGVPADLARAVRLYRMAAERGDVRGLFALAVCCERGIGMAPNATEAYRLYEQAAEDGYAPAQNNLGGCYEHGLGVAQNHSTAVEWYARAAATQPHAACRLGMCYEHGHGVASDYARAQRCYEAAAAEGHGYALYRLGLGYEQGYFTEAEVGAPTATAVVPHEATRPSKEDTKEVEVPSNGSERGTAGGDVKGQARTPRYAHAVRFWEQAAAKGTPDAAYALSLAYAYGRGVRRDEARSLHYLRMAADGGMIQACFTLGMRYMEGRGTVQDGDRAQALLTRATELWSAAWEDERAQRYLRAVETDRCPTDALSPMEAAGNAYYMLGYMAMQAGDGAHTTEVERAANLFRLAARLEHIGAITALGDLYAYGLLTSDAADREDESLRYYMEAVRLGTARQSSRTEHAEAEAQESPVPALMSLAERSARSALASLDEGDRGAAELAWVQAWRCLAGGAEQGSVDALVGMAECAFLGHGTPENRAAAVWFLERAEQLDGGRVTASLWLGDLRRTDWCGTVDYAAADAAYRRALHTPYVDSECGDYTVKARRAARCEADRRAHAEACYRLATLRAVHFADDAERGEAFSYLAEAILMKHTAALDDLARMYAYETTYIDATTPAERGRRGRGKAASPSPKEGIGGLHSLRGAAARRRYRRHARPSGTQRDGRAARSHHGWLTDYYTALWPEPSPFCYDMVSAAVGGDRPAYVTASVTDAMRAAALNYLGDCLFYERGVARPHHREAAVACYRAVVDMKLTVGRGEPMPVGVVWAWYSLGWCLLHGVGTAPNPREAVAWLTRAARTHAEACYCLGQCHEQGLGVDVSDDREAIRYYRKAVKLGYGKAEKKVYEIEKRLKEEAT